MGCNRYRDFLLYDFLCIFGFILGMGIWVRGVIRLIILLLRFFFLIIIIRCFKLIILIIGCVVFRGKNRFLNC